MNRFLAGLLVIFLAGCTTVEYRVGDAEVRYQNGVFEKSFSALSVVVDPETGVRTITVEGYKSEAAQIAGAVAGQFMEKLMDRTP